MVDASAQATGFPGAADSGPILEVDGPPKLPDDHPLPLPEDGPVEGADLASYLPGDGGVSPSGTYSYSIPLAAPSGRAGMEPKLSLSYSSGGSNGPVGMGWSVSGLSSIRLCQKTLAEDNAVAGVKFDGSDRFCLDGQKLVAVGSPAGAYGANGTQYRTETDSFARIKSVISGGSTLAGPDYFEVRAKNGRILKYDAFAVNVLDSAVKPQWVTAQTSSPRRAIWLLTSERDRNGNEIRYEYTQPAAGDGSYLPLRVRYTFGAGHEALRKVEFEYENRGDAETSYGAGVAYSLTKRMKTVSMWAPNPAATQLVWRYELGYGDGYSNRGRSMLRSVRRCGYLGGCTRAKQFSYANPAEVPQFAEAFLPPDGQLDVGGSEKPGLRVADFNGDGADDVVYNLGGSGFFSNPAYVRLGKRTSPLVISPLQSQYPLGSASMGFVHDSALLRPADVDNDGRTELMLNVKQDSGGGLIVDKTKVVRWDSATNQFVGTGFSVPYAKYYNLADMDGDGRIDFLANDVPSPDPQLYANSYSIRLNTGTGFAGPQSSTFESGCPVRVTDTDGDGRAELVGNPRTPKTAPPIVEEGDPVPPPVDRCLNPLETSVLRLGPNGPVVQDGTQWVNGTAQWRVVPFLKDTVTTLGDFNGDGLSDALVFPNDPYKPGRLLFNTGNGMVVGSEVLGVPHGVSGKADIRVADLNGDHRDDFVALSAIGGLQAFIYHGVGNFASYPLAADAGTVVPGLDRNTTQLGDFNADGRVDVVRFINGQLRVLSQTSSATDVAPDRMTGVTDEGTGFVRDTVHYALNWTDHPKESVDNNKCGYPLMCLRAGFPVVRKVESRAHLVDVDPTTAAARVIEYSYEDAVADVRGRGGLGFGVFREWDPQRPAERITTFDHRVQVDGRYYPYGGVPAKVQEVVPILTQDQVGSWLTPPARISRTTYTSVVRKLNSNTTYAVFPDTSHTVEWEQSISMLFGSLAATSQAEHIVGIDQNPTPLRVRDTETEYSNDDFGNLVSSSVQTAGGVRDAVVTSYDNRVRNGQDPDKDWLIGLPTQTLHTRVEPANGGITVRTTDRHFDDRGRPDVVWLEKDNADPDVHQTAYHGYAADGVLTTMRVDDDSIEVEATETGLPMRVSHIEYDPVFPGQPDENVFASQLWSEHNPAQYRPSGWSAVHPAYGVTVATRDANLVGTTSRIDDLGRVVRSDVDGAGSTVVGYAPRQDAVAKAGLNGTVVTTTGPTGTTKVSTNASGRTISAAGKGFDGSFAESKIGYDLLGRPATSTRPAPEGITTSAYDSLNRLVNVTGADGKSTISVHGFGFTKVIDPNGYDQRTWLDLDGRREHTVDRLIKPDGSAQELTTRYTYLPFDLVRTITDPAGNVTTMGYDTLGRRTTLTDPDRGRSATTYYGTGELHTDSHLDSGRITTVGYDDLGRKTSVTTEDGTATFGYDTAAHGIGKMATATSPDNVRTDFRYDNAGRAAGTDYIDQIAGVTYATDLHYDSGGRPYTQEFPQAGPAGTSRLVEQFDYNAAGHLESIRYAKPGDNLLQPLWTVQSRKPNLALDTGTLGGGAGAITITRGYQNLTGRTANLHATAAGPTGGTSTLMDLSYTYYDNGLVKTRAQNDTRGVRTETFSYDTVSRLTKWNLKNGTSPALDYGYGYDTAGNILPQGIGEDRIYGGAAGATPHAITSRDSVTAGVETYHYDPDGRLTSTTDEAGQPIQSTSYTAADLPRQVTNGSKTTSYRYDAFGSRFQETTRVNNAVTAVVTTVGGLYEKRVTGGTTKHVYYISSPDGPVAQITYDGATTDVQYQLADSLGSISAVVNPAGAVTQSLYYEPYGARINPDGTPFTGSTGDTSHGFTNHEHDDDLGTINMKGRIYSPALKQFLSPDPISDTSTSQTAHPYSYVHNTPLNFTDPTGYMGCNSGIEDRGSDCGDQPNRRHGGHPQETLAFSTPAPTPCGWACEGHELWSAAEPGYSDSDGQATAVDVGEAHRPLDTEDPYEGDILNNTGAAEGLAPTCNLSCDDTLALALGDGPRVGADGKPNPPVTEREVRIVAVGASVLVGAPVVVSGARAALLACYATPGCVQILAALAGTVGNPHDLSAGVGAAAANAEAKAMEALAETAKRMTKAGYTAAGREYQKHMMRGELPQLSQAPKVMNEAGQNLLNAILYNPAKTVVAVGPGSNFAGGTRFIVPGAKGSRGIGATFDKDGVFAYFGLY